MNIFSRYQSYIKNGETVSSDFIKLDSKVSDRKIVWKEGVSRLDKISQEYYGSPYYGWLIMMVNSQYGGLEFLIPDNSLITVPYPLQNTLDEYYNKIENKKR